MRMESGTAEGQALISCSSLSTNSSVIPVGGTAIGETGGPVATAIGAGTPKGIGGTARVGGWAGRGAAGEELEDSWFQRLDKEES